MHIEQWNTDDVIPYDHNPRVNDAAVDAVARSIAGRRALLGLDAPTRIAPTSPDGDESYDVHVIQKLLHLAEQTPAGPTVIDAEYIERQLKQIDDEAAPDAGVTHVPEEEDHDCTES